MTRSEVLQKIIEARDAIKKYKDEGLEITYLDSEKEKVTLIKRSSEMLISEARTIGASGQTCPTCGGSGRA